MDMSATVVKHRGIANLDRRLDVMTVPGRVCRGERCLLLSEQQQTTRGDHGRRRIRRSGRVSRSIEVPVSTVTFRASGAQVSCDSPWHNSVLRDITEEIRCHMPGGVQEVRDLRMRIHYRKT